MSIDLHLISLLYIIHGVIDKITMITLINAKQNKNRNYVEVIP